MVTPKEIKSVEILLSVSYSTMETQKAKDLLVPHSSVDQWGYHNLNPN